MVSAICGFIVIYFIFKTWTPQKRGSTEGVVARLINLASEEKGEKYDITEQTAKEVFTNLLLAGKWFLIYKKMVSWFNATDVITYTPFLNLRKAEKQGIMNVLSAQAPCRFQISNPTLFLQNIRAGLRYWAAMANF